MRKSPIKITEKMVDTAMSEWIRARDKECVYPYGTSQYKPGEHAGSLQNSHYHGRTARSTRYDVDNCDALCGRHHQFLEGRKNGEYADWKLEQLGQERFDALKKRYYATKQYTQEELWSLFLTFSMDAAKSLLLREAKKLRTKAASTIKAAERNAARLIKQAEELEAKAR